jgi:hypothetical protein
MVRLPLKWQRQLQGICRMEWNHKKVTKIKHLTNVSIHHFQPST